jgi:hypothetical protein
LSTNEAEYVALTRAAQSAVHFCHLLHDVHHHVRGLCMKTTKAP